MEAITDTTSLDRRINALEQKREQKKDAIQGEFQNLRESLKPANLIRGLFRSVNESPDLKSDILHGAMGLGTGFLTNKLLLGKLHGPLKSLLGMILPAVITKTAVQHSEDLKEKGATLLARLLRGMKIQNDEDLTREQHVRGGAVL